MTTKAFDPFSFPNMNRNTVGLEQIMKSIFNANGSYPPYNIKKVGDNKYVIEMAVAGFGKNDITIEMQEGVLKVKGEVSAAEPSEYIFKGIAERNFVRQFTLADSVEVKNADLFNGMLKIWLDRLAPEPSKPVKIDINDK
jgi:molecular chaperone IbpA